MSLGSLAAETMTDPQSAREQLEESLSLFRELGVPSQTATVLSSLASLAIAAGDYELAITHANESLVIFERLGNSARAGLQLVRLAHARLERGELERARETLVAAREKLRREPAIVNTVALFELAFLFAYDAGAFARAAAILGFLDGVRSKHRLPRTAASQAQSQRRETDLPAKLGDAFAVRYELGKRSGWAEMERTFDMVLATTPVAATAGSAAQ